ncbi:hypothetical protein E2C01_058868 [Portunus trituberculatus]|uniref:Uncharacterized protein n=1 Tax=Portunus trituberculatus TaxID=210409 RepID=A0A5B7H6T8_PORTR|nr:hypothetical protein [Portunus trituberculatus]
METETETRHSSKLYLSTCKEFANNIFRSGRFRIISGREDDSKDLLATVGVNYHSITTPALAFIQRDQKSATTLLNDYDDALEWIKEQLFVMHQKEPQSKDEQGYLPVQVVGEYY